jgi:PAS domain S-box-containing protein
MEDKDKYRYPPWPPGPENPWSKESRDKFQADMRRMREEMHDRRKYPRPPQMPWPPMSGDPWDKEKNYQFRMEMRRLREDMRRRRKSPGPGMNYLFWGLMLILWGIIIALLKQDIIVTDQIWKVFLTGLGGIFLIQAVVFSTSPETRPMALGKFTPGIILTLVGLGMLFGLSSWWPVMMVGAGIAVIFISWFLQREIVKRRYTQETLRESEEKYRYIIDNANSAIVEIDKAGRVIFINRFALDFFGFSENEILNHNAVGTIIPDEAAANWNNLLNKVGTAPEDFSQDETENLRKNGSRVWMAWTYKPILDEAGNLKELLCTGIDRTMQKQDEEKTAREIKERTTVEERNRLARDLHDAVSQTLFSTSLIAEVLPKLWERNPDAGKAKLEEVRQLTRGALAEMRTLLFELRPAALADADLNDLLKQLAESVTGRARVPVAVEVQGTFDAPTDVKIALYRIAQEALNNIAKHSGATQARVSLQCSESDIALRIMDNGRGFDVAQTANGSFGLSNIKERAAQIGANLDISSKIDEGTEIAVTWRSALER